jgi:hypothetical protein
MSFNLYVAGDPVLSVDMTDVQVSLRGMKVELEYWRSRTRTEWMRSLWDCSDDEPTLSPPSNKETATSFSTVLPTYCIYQRTWNRSKYRSPLEVNWMKFDENDQNHIGYMVDISEIMEEQLGLWVQDSEYMDDRETSIFETFKCYTRSMDRLWNAIRDHRS